MLRQIRALVIAVLLLPQVVSAATLTDGVYGVTDLTDFSGFDRIAYGIIVRGYNDGAEKLWSADPGATFTVSNSGMNARLQGSVTNVFDSNIGFGFDILFGRDLAGSDGYCQFDGVPDPGCGNAFSTNLKATNQIDPSAWWYFDLLAGSTFTGTGAMAGIIYDITDMSSGAHPLQVGESANGLTLGGLGLSFWYWYDMRGQTSNLEQNGYIFRHQGGGDFNLDLTTPPVPLPAAVWMLLAALGGMAVAGRRKAA